VMVASMRSIVDVEEAKIAIDALNESTKLL